MPTTLGPVQIANLALMRVGARTITDIDAEDSPSAAAIRDAWQGSITEVSRSRGWSCLLEAVALVEEPQTPIDPSTATPASTAWAPFTVYAAGVYVTYGLALYQALIANTSTANFTNDLTSGYWFETDIGNTDPFGGCVGSQYASGWGYKFPLPDDCLLVATLNDQDCSGIIDTFEIIGTALYTDEPTAIIKYVKYQEDTTRWDALFAGCVVLMLASKIATLLRQDDTNIAALMTQLYKRALCEARAKDGAERRVRRYDPVANSDWIAARRWSTNG